MSCDVEPGDGSGCPDCEAAGTTKSCSVHRKHVQPLAFSLLERARVLSQESSPLFSVLPKELRDTIYEYAFTDGNNHPNQDQQIRHARDYSVTCLPKPSIAFSLLLTCRAVYLEAYQLPYTLNPVTIYRICRSPELDIMVPNISRLAPWQFALIQSLDIGMRQTDLEGSTFRNYTGAYHAAERHQGAVVLAQYFNHEKLQAPDIIPAFNLFGLKLKDQVSLSQISLTARTLKTSLGNTVISRQPMIARPLVRLTIRMGCTDWWTWTDAPTNTQSQLGLDPSIGDGSVHTRPTTALMLQLAEDRRQGRWRGYTNSLCWGNNIAKFQSLKEFSLVLETFAAKKSQLDNVVESAKIWTFPMDKHHELRYTGKIESSTWRECVSPENTDSVQRYEYLRTVIPWREPQEIQVLGGQAVAPDSATAPAHPNEFHIKVIRWERTRK